ncbi:ABC transporter ATP-binding protein [Shinella sp.]|uniref:ABC transporter ATP-binding protein n=1 Tax=Shinella sp. TaxID=1870904 RepID=UPI003F701B6A
MRSGRVNLREVHKAYGSFRALDGVSLDIKAGEFLTLLGPSGSGKTTLLNVIAGFERPDLGSLLVDDVEFITRPPHKRDLGMVFQNYALFPHMDVFSNVAYPLKLRKVDRPSIRRRVMDALEIVHMQHLADRRITALSGGQRQRVALARAFVFEPRLLLMDEPLSALDKNLREHMQIELKRLHRQLGMTTIYVTHDQQEALTMSDRIAVLDKGRIVQLDVPATVYDRPNCKFVAGFMGETRFLPVERRDQSYVLDGRPLRLADTRAASSTGDAWLMVRPERLRWQGDADRDNRIEGRVLDVVYRGDCNQVSVSLPGGHEVAIRHSGAERQPLPQPGDILALWLPAEASLVIGSAAP